MIWEHLDPVRSWCEDVVMLPTGPYELHHHHHLESRSCRWMESAVSVLGSTAQLLHLTLVQDGTLLRHFQSRLEGLAAYVEGAAGREARRAAEVPDQQAAVSSTDSSEHMPRTRRKLQQ